MADADDLFGRIRNLKEAAAVASQPNAVEQPSAVGAFIQDIHRKRAVVQALEEFIQNIHVADGLPREEAQRNVAESLVELMYHGQHSSNGLLITDDGYFLTALHCVQNDEKHPLEQAQICLYDGTMYPVEKVCARVQSEDLAIVKAAIPKACRPRQYRFYNTNVLDNDPVILLSRRDGNIIVKEGSITSANYAIPVRDEDHPDIVYYNHFLTNHASIPGDSGGTIITPDGRVAGLVSCGNNIITSGVKLIRILNIIDGYKRHIQKSLE